MINKSTAKVKFIILAGGLGQCSHLFNILNDKFVTGGKIERVVQPAQCGTAVVVGGVYLGQNSTYLFNYGWRQTIEDKQQLNNTGERREEVKVVVPSISLIKLKDLSKLEKVGEGAQGIIYRAEWKGSIVIYKQVKLVTSRDDKKEFMKEFNVWQYDCFFLLV